MDEKNLGSHHGQDTLTMHTLTMHTFRSCGHEFFAKVEIFDSTEISDVARAVHATYLETARLYTWATGATTRADMTRETIDRFVDVLGRISGRFGTLTSHYDITVADAIAQCVARGGEPRAHATIMRHRNRLRRLLKQPMSRFADRIKSGGLLEISEDEISRIAGWAEHRGFLLVERHGAIQLGIVLQTFDRMLDPSASAESLAPVLIKEAEQKRAETPELGRAFIATRHRGHLRLVSAFWEAV